MGDSYCNISVKCQEGGHEILMSYKALQRLIYEIFHEDLITVFLCITTFCSNLKTTKFESLILLIFSLNNDIAM